MKKLFQILLAGLFLAIVVSFTCERKSQVISAVDDDVGISVSVDIQQNFEITDQTQFVCNYQYQEVGIVPTEFSYITNDDKIILQDKFDNKFTKSCNQMFYDGYRYEQVTKTTNFKEDYEWYCTNNYVRNSMTKNYNTTIKVSKEICKTGINCNISKEVIGLVLEPNHEFHTYSI